MTDRHQAFDYVIVAAGSAGCVLAARLTEDETVSVLLPEAGPAARSWVIDMPSGVGRLLSSERRSVEHTRELQSLMRNSSAVFCLQKKNYVSLLYLLHKHNIST